MDSIQFIWPVWDYLFIVNIIFAILLIFFERHNPTVTLTWLLVLFFVPVAGFILYIFLGGDMRKKRLFFLKVEEEQNFFPALAQQDESLHTNRLVFNNPRVQEYRDIILLHLNSNQSLFTQDNEVEIFNDGEELFEELINSLRRARKFIHMEYYVIRNDSSGKAVRDVLAEKAREGVEVKLLYDGMGCLHLPRKFFQPLFQAGVEVSSFFPPFLPYINLRINYRNHRKICIIDGEEGFLGGFNIGDEYRNLSRKFGYWRDTHLRIRGSALNGLQLRFLLDWRFTCGYDFEVMGRYFPQYPPQGETGVQIVSSGPDSKWSSIRDGYLRMINKARKNVYIQTPYFVPDDSILEALKIAALSGVDVRLLVPDKADHLFVHWANLSYVGELLEAGVRCYFYTNRGFLHSKMLLVDGFASSVGTANMDIRSFQLNFEVNAFIYDEQVTRELEAAFLKDLDNSSEVTMEAYMRRPARVRIKEAFSRLLSPLL